ncbi:UNVERIFIED_CONTAM: slgA [Trichonephila clavipes]
MAVIFRSLTVKKKFAKCSCALWNSNLRFKSSAVLPQDPIHRAESTPQRDPLDLSFENTKDAFKSKTTWELFRAFLVLKLSTYSYLVENHEKLIAQGKKILGPALFNFVMKHTFYGHFVAGEDAKSIKPLLDRLRSFGVKSILDYSAEEDMSEDQAKEAMKNNVFKFEI